MAIIYNSGKFIFLNTVTGSGLDVIRPLILHPLQANYNWYLKVRLLDHCHLSSNMCFPYVVLYICMRNCIVHMFGWATRKISCELTGSPSLNKVFELNWINNYSIPTQYCITPIKHSNNKFTVKIKEITNALKVSLRKHFVFVFQLV